MEPRLRAIPEQFLVLIDFMERRGDISKPQSSAQGRFKGHQLWQDLATTLNSVNGGVKKSADKWKKVWADWKTKTKKKYLTIRQHSSGGGGSSSRASLTALEERVVAVIGVSAVAGQAIQEQGFNKPSNDPPLIHVEDSSSEMPSAEEEKGELEHFVPDYSQNTESIVQSPPRTTLPPTRETATSPPQLSPFSPSHPRTPPARSSRRQASASSRSSFLRARRNRALTPFERATNKLLAFKIRRLEFEERRDRRLHARELQRIEVNREHNQLLHQLSLIGQRLIDVLTRSTRLPSE
ncbi:unnamed protein product [Spodoptera exigua]|nr:unnamed protein product [Spodoptera exigua]